MTLPPDPDQPQASDAGPPGPRRHEQRAVTSRRNRTSARRGGRRAGQSGTADAILAAARARFADLGYDGTTIRAIAADADVDPALVHHFYGSKEALFGAAMRLPVVPGEVLAAALAPGSREPGVTLGQHMVQTAMRLWEVPEVRTPFLGLLRSAVTSERAAAMLREFITGTILRPIARAAGAEAEAAGRALGSGSATAEYRASMVASQMLGLALTRYLLALGPVAAASPEELALTIGPALDRYLTGELWSAREP